MITRDPRLAWQLAFDDGQRSQLEVIIGRLETGCDVQTGCKRNEPASRTADYRHVVNCIDSLAPPVQWVGHYMNRQGAMSERTASKVETMAALSVAQLAQRSLPGFSQWSEERQQLLYYVAMAALRRTWILNFDQPEVTDSKGRSMGARLDKQAFVSRYVEWRAGRKLNKKNWAREWSGVWELLLRIVDMLDEEGFNAVSESLGLTPKPVIS
ncbi:hypothetical protein [Zymobacter sp. IVIA_12111.31 C1]|uniref:hypothetical protein n=1 Tax=Zymobacter sp. IVIA_12111.31 C1 TaxID=3394854 RepID=UPI0039C09061